MTILAWERGELAIDKDLSMQVSHQQQAQKQALNCGKIYGGKLVELCFKTAQF